MGLNSVSKVESNSGNTRGESIKSKKTRGRPPGASRRSKNPNHILLILTQHVGSEKKLVKQLGKTTLTTQTTLTSSNSLP